MNRSFTSLVLIALTFVSNVYAQRTQSSTPEPKAKEFVTPRILFRANTTHRMEFVDSTVVVRTYSDSSTKEYFRFVKYFISMTGMKDPELDGEQLIEMRLDSMQYRFREGATLISYNSQDSSHLAPIDKFPDLIGAMVPNGRLFEVLFAPYNSLREIAGADLDWVREYMKGAEDQGMDSLIAFVWNRNLKTEILANFLDPIKNMIRNTRIATDSVWAVKPQMVADGVILKSTGSMKLDSYDGGVFISSATFPQISAEPQKVRLYGFQDYVVDIKQVTGTGSTVFDCTQHGTLRNQTTFLDLRVLAQVKSEQFSQHITSKQSWQLQGISK